MWALPVLLIILVNILGSDVGGVKSLRWLYKFNRIYKDIVINIVWLMNQAKGVKMYILIMLKVKGVNIWYDNEI